MIITREQQIIEDKNKHQETRAEFPQLILDGGHVRKSEEISIDKAVTLSTREIIMFVLFCGCFIVVLYLQLNIQICFNTNDSIRRSLFQQS